VKVFIEWRGFPKDFELSFVTRMNELESEGFPFEVVIRSTAPKVLGEGPSQIFLRWVGKKARRKPRLFVKAFRKEFGKNSGEVLTKLETSVDVEGLRDRQKSYIPPNEYLVNAMLRDGLIQEPESENKES
jgi:hypothetical protein